MEEEEVILDFCATCGSLLEEAGGLVPDPECPNCGESVKSRESRCQGTFSIKDSERLRNTR